MFAAVGEAGVGLRALRTQMRTGREGGGVEEEGLKIGRARRTEFTDGPLRYVLMYFS
jgi:hypothetical protein